MKSIVKNEDPRYMLRRTLFPWKLEETIDEVVRYVKEFGVDEVIWKVDCEEFSHGLPSHDIIDRAVPHLKRSRGLLAEVGTMMSINPWVTMGHRDAGWDLRDKMRGFEGLTDISGIKAKSQACPLGPAWREWLKGAYLRYASAGPRVLWLEDDMRIHHHRPVKFACFCDRHLKEFAKIAGREFTREELAAEVLKPGEPTEIRKLWLDFLGSVIVDVVRMVADAVYSQYPEVQLGLMTSAPWFHGMEVRDWDGLMEALAGNHGNVFIRPCMGNYNELSDRGLYPSRQFVAGTIKCVRKPARFCTEVENWPFTRFSKSVSFTRMQLLASATMKCQSMTLNLYDHLGTPLYDESEYGVMLRDTHPMLDALTAVYAPEGVERGVGVLMNEQGGKFKKLAEGAEYGDISMSSEPWADIIEALGAPATWAESPVTVVTGQKLEAEEDRLDEIFKGGVLLDLSAVRPLIAMGREELAGVEIIETFKRKEKELPAEEPVEAQFGGEGGRYMTADHISVEFTFGHYRPLEGARAISMLVNPDREPQMPGFVICDNPLGGRTAVCPIDLSGGMPIWFLNWHRKRQMLGLLDWLFRGRSPLEIWCGAYPLPIRTDYPDYTLVSAMNLSQDVWPRTRMRLGDIEKAGKCQMLHTSGEWRELNDMKAGENGLEIGIDHPVPAREMLTVKIDRK